MIPTPHQIFSSFERGEIERDEVHALMALHARELIQEMQEDDQNPAAALLEKLLCSRSAARLIRHHGGRLLREVFIALSEVPDFPPAHYLWNASHPDVPLRCFLRMRREPVFYIDSITTHAGGTEVAVVHGRSGRGKGTHRRFLLKRDDHWRLRVVPD
jgi:hypothetical protein